MQRRRMGLAGLAVAGLIAAGLSVPSEAKDHSRAFLGVFLSGDAFEDETGVRVEGVVKDSAADRSKMEAGDVIVSFNGRRVDDLSDLGEQLRAASPDDKVQIVVVRDGRHRTVDVTLGTRASEDHEVVYGRDWPKLGVQIVGTTPELREHLGGDLDHGALVGKVLADMPAEKAGLAVGDLILSVDGKSVRNAASLMAALRDKDGKTVDLEVARDHGTVHLQAALP